MDSTIALKVERVDAITPRINRLVLSGATVSALSYEAGAHIELHVPPASAGGARLHRAYSLVRPGCSEGTLEIAVQLEEPSSGGSKWVHQLKAGDALAANAPSNHFPLHGAETRPLLIAAGIGITPILCMALSLKERGQPFDMHYVARDAEQAAYAQEVEALPGAHCWFDGGDPARRVDLREVIGKPVAGRHLHVCGPKGFIEATLATARELGWPEEQLHCELFVGSLQGASDKPFTVELKAAGITLDVPTGKTVMDVMEEAGLDPMFDCRRGDCGICVAKVLDGEADHRDICLSAKDHQAGSFCICVSRARSDHLVLDL
ncbi:MAG: PDR/VanB family oxidoreductase [Aquabacterium sp.]|uniref:PDR/VanB family oxidoreductase n=1 Tax=Aquabacterium sp. TaxID=1872578 RepID=UPI003BAE91DD